MYDELVKRLRKKASFWCINCRYRAGDCICAAPDDRKEDCDICSQLQAADAIEELSKGQKDLSEQVAKWQAEVVKGDCEAWLSEQDKPHWIPVTEKLPNDRRDVQITVFWHDAWRTMYGYYDGAFWHLYAPMHTEVADVYVIGWMEKPAPMPGPPKEEK